MPTQIILVLNSGSSSVKFSIFESQGSTRTKILEGSIEGIGKSGKFWLKDQAGNKIKDETPEVPNLEAAFHLISENIGETPTAIGHRMVCGGPTVIENQLITPALLEEMQKYTNFAPLHTPSELFLMRQAIKLFPMSPTTSVSTAASTATFQKSPAIFLSPRNTQRWACVASGLTA